MGELTDLALMERIVSRDTDALKALYDRYGRICFALAYRVTGEASGAEEIVLRRADPHVGEVNVHFPRAGYDAVPA